MAAAAGEMGEAGELVACLVDWEDRMVAAVPTEARVASLDVADNSAGVAEAKVEMVDGARIVLATLQRSTERRSNRKLVPLTPPHTCTR